MGKIRNVFQAPYFHLCFADILRTDTLNLDLKGIIKLSHDQSTEPAVLGIYLDVDTCLIECTDKDIVYFTVIHLPVMNC